MDKESEPTGKKLSILGDKTVSIEKLEKKLQLFCYKDCGLLKTLKTALGKHKKAFTELLQIPAKNISNQNFCYSLSKTIKLLIFSCTCPHLQMIHKGDDKFVRSEI